MKLLSSIKNVLIKSYILFVTMACSRFMHDLRQLLMKQIKFCNSFREIDSGERNYKDFCLLYRTHSVSRSLLDQLTIHKIPFIKHGASQSFYEHSLIRPVLDHLRLVLEPFRLESLSNILPTMYIGRDECISFIEREQWKYGEGRFPSSSSFSITKPKLETFSS